MKIVCVVLNWNGWRDTIECLDSLLNSTHPEFHIVVVDNGSRDGSFERMQSWAHDRPDNVSFAVFSTCDEAIAAADSSKQLIFVRQPSNLGYAGGNNIGLRLALERLGADAVWILNNDTVVDRPAMARLAAFLNEHPNTAIVGARLYNYFAPGRLQALGGGAFTPSSARDTQIGRGRTLHPLMGQEIDLDHVVGASMMVRASAISDVGALDESYFLYREETDWCIRMRARGWKLTYCPTAVVWHKERHTRMRVMLYDYYSVRNMLFMVRRFYPKSIPFAIMFTVGRVLGPKVLRLQFGRLALSIRAFSDFLRGERGMRTVDPDATIARMSSRDRGSD